MKINYLILLAPLLLCGCGEPSLSSATLAFAGPLIMALLAIPAIIALSKSGKIPCMKDLLPDRRFNDEHITHTFIAALPTLSREMNLEVASSKQTEVLERTNGKRFLGIDLGTNVARLSVPTTYRYHICLYDEWKLHTNGAMLIVLAPEIKCSIPPAIHTDEIQQTTARGWARCQPVDLVTELHRDLTPILSQYANDHRRLELVRTTCRQSVAEFIRRWLENEKRWRPGKFTAINVQFAGEPSLPASPTLELLSFNS